MSFEAPAGRRGFLFGDMYLPNPALLVAVLQGQSTADV